MIPTGGNFVVIGQYGTLTIHQNGNYSYTRTDLEAGGVEDVFIYTLTDGDGDTATATLTIGIQDNFPEAGNVNVQLDDDALPAATWAAPTTSTRIRPTLAATFPARAATARTLSLCC